jgi:hypothetical protein
MWMWMWKYRRHSTAANPAARCPIPAQWICTHVVLLPDIHPLPILVHPQRLGLTQRLHFLPVIVVPRLGESLEGERRGDDEGQERESEEDERVSSDLG